MVISRNMHSTFMMWDIDTGEAKGQLICDTPVGDSPFNGFECWDADKVRAGVCKTVDIGCVK
jgi:hypothetical protein